MDFLLLVAGSFIAGVVLGVGYRAGAALGKAATRDDDEYIQEMGIIMEHTHGGESDDL